MNKDENPLEIIKKYALKTAGFIIGASSFIVEQGGKIAELATKDTPNKEGKN